MRKFKAYTHDPLVLELLQVAEADPRTELEICADAGHGTGSLSKLRRAQGGMNVQKFRDLGATVGLELVWRKKEDHVPRRSRSKALRTKQRLAAAGVGNLPKADQGTAEEARKPGAHTQQGA